MIPPAPQLPPSIETLLRTIRRNLETARLLERIPSEKAAAWDEVVEQWAMSDLPLIVRRAGHPEMCMKVHHCDGRVLAPADNSPAHWMVMQCFSDVPASLDYVRSQIEKIPMTMRMSKEEAAVCDFPIRLDELAHAGEAGWYLAHIEPVGLGRIGALEAAPMGRLQDHFRKLMRPSNMLLIARTVSGLAEIDTFIR